MMNRQIIVEKCVMTMKKKYAFVKEVLWNDGEHFIGLDHEIPLGINGISLGEYN